MGRWSLCVGGLAALLWVHPGLGADGDDTFPMAAPTRDVASHAATSGGADDVIETAFLVPDLLVKPLVQEEVALPRPLSAEDAGRYRRALAAQAAGRFAEADRLLKQVTDPLLEGVVLGQRYLADNYRSSHAELAGWLAKYADHADALLIHGLAVKRSGPRAPAPKRPPPGFLLGQGDVESTLSWDPPYQPKRMTAAGERARAAIRAAVRAGQLEQAERLAEVRALKGLLDPVAIADLHGEIAWSLFLAGNHDRALALAGPAARIGGHQVPLLHWTAGLAAWKGGKLDEAARNFEALASSERTSPWNASAGAYWASRSHLAARRPGESVRWLTRAATFPTTFYGLLARRALGIELPIHWRNPPLTQEDLAALLRFPGAQRALALVQIDEPELAERELRRLHPSLDPSLTAAVASIAARAGLSPLSIRLGARLAHGENGERWHAALYPIPSLAPSDGWRIDRALVFALARHESGFNARAVSPAGARGLMQLMPGTARAMARRGEKVDGEALLNPAHNLALGQRYIEALLNHEKINGNLFLMVASYNSGPGNIMRWMERGIHKDDPLLFIETIPARETRQFVEKVLTSAWIYRMRLGQPTSSLDAIAAGDWPVYVPQDDERVLQAAQRR